MNRPDHFPNFWEVLAKALQQSASRSGVVAYLPWLLISFIAFGGTSAYLIAYLLHPQLNTADTLTSLSAMLVVGGLLASVSIACMTQIYVTVSDPLFGDYLKEENVFDQFLFWPQMTLLVQIGYVILLAVLTVLSLTTSDPFVRLAATTYSTSLLVYVTVKTWNLIEAQRLLAWHRQEYASLFLKAQHGRG